MLVFIGFTRYVESRSFNKRLTLWNDITAITHRQKQDAYALFSRTNRSSSIHQFKVSAVLTPAPQPRGAIDINDSRITGEFSVCLSFVVCKARNTSSRKLNRGQRGKLGGRIRAFTKQRKNIPNETAWYSDSIEGFNGTWRSYMTYLESQFRRLKTRPLSWGYWTFHLFSPLV